MEEWESDASYLEAKAIVSSLHSVNDAAERAVKFGSDYTQVLTKSEDQRQDIIQNVELSRRAYPKATRQCFTGEVSTANTVDELMKVAKYDAR